jgi:hypothetical protein
MENTVIIEGLYKAGKAAYDGISFDSEKRGRSIEIAYNQELNEDLKTIPESEHEAYISGYKKHLFAWLSAMSRCMSVMITGPARFPVERNRKNNEIANKRSVEFTEWRENQKKYIAKRQEAAKPQDQKDSERWQRIKKGLESTIETIIEIDLGINTYSARSLFVSSLTGVIKRMAQNGQIEDVKKALELVKYWNQKATNPIITAKNSIWSLIEVAEVVKEKTVDKETAQSKKYEINGVKVVENIQADRIQLFFDGKPKQEIINELKHAAFKWSPFNGCWQRQLTNNARYATNYLLKKIA